MTYTEKEAQRTFTGVKFFQESTYSMPDPVLFVPLTAVQTVPMRDASTILLRSPSQVLFRGVTTIWSTHRHHCVDPWSMGIEQYRTHTTAIIYNAPRQIPKSGPCDEREVASSDIVVSCTGREGP